MTRPARVLIVVPSWVGDAVMATWAMRLVRDALPGSFIAGLVRPGIDELLAGTGLLDEFHVERPTGVLGPKFIAARLRPRRYGVALLLTNSFSSALTARIAGIPERVGYARDARSMLLTVAVRAPRTPGGAWAPVPAVSYYDHAARAMLGMSVAALPSPALPDGARMELVATDADRDAAASMLERARIDGTQRLAILFPGGNDAAKRWPADRYARIADHLRDRHGLRVLVSGSPGERALASSIAAASEGTVALTEVGVTLGALKGVLASGRVAIAISNDTGPRHMAAAMRVPVVSLFGPTDHRWTTIPAPAGERVLLADPTLPESETANDHPDRCRIDRIEVERVAGAADDLLRGGAGASG